MSDEILINAKSIQVGLTGRGAGDLIIADASGRRYRVPITSDLVEDLRGALRNFDDVLARGVTYKFGRGG